MSFFKMSSTWFRVSCGKIITKDTKLFDFLSVSASDTGYNGHFQSDWLPATKLGLHRFISLPGNKVMFTRVAQMSAFEAELSTRFALWILSS